MAPPAVKAEPHREGPCPHVGLLAGWGRYPVVIAETLREQGCRVVCAGLRHHADAGALRGVCDTYKWVGIGRMGAVVRLFSRHGVTQAMLAGKFHKKILYQPWVWLRHTPDLTAARHFYPYFIGTKRDRTDDTLSAAVVDGFARYGITFKPATDFVPELLVNEGHLTNRTPNTSQQRDIEFGWHLAKEMGGLDVGQTVVVKGRAVLAVEAIEGTDECIRRAGQLCPSGGFTVVKVAKPDQDMRFDVPTIGIGTLQSIVAAGGRLLAIEAGKTIVVDEPEVIEFANRHKLVITAIPDLESKREAA
ncbi:MAG: UDP-2,3-diacylglucosamine diphosphatase LpxI [Pirellulales bacterium]